MWSPGLLCCSRFKSLVCSELQLCIGRHIWVDRWLRRGRFELFQSFVDLRLQHAQPSTHCWIRLENTTRNSLPFGESCNSPAVLLPMFRLAPWFPHAQIQAAGRQDSPRNQKERSLIPALSSWHSSRVKVLILKIGSWICSWKGLR